MNKKPRFFLICASLISIVMFSACSEKMPSQTQLHMGTVCTINLFSDGNKNVYDEMFQELVHLENIFSTNLPDSDVSRINRSSGIKPEKVSSQLIYVLENACKIAQETDGAFDPSIEPLVRLWGIGSDNPKVPSQQEIEEKLSLVNYKDIQIDSKNETVFLPVSGMGIDLGGIAKGYAADCLVKIAKKHKVKSAIFDLGGNIYVYGKKEDGSQWRVGIKNPLQPSARPIVRLDLTNKTVVTSGMYERYFDKDGKRYHHILDAKTGYPVENDVLSVTIISDSSMIADALSTSSFILGKKSGMEVVALENSEAVFVMKDKTVLTSDGIKNSVLILSEEYNLLNN